MANKTLHIETISVNGTVQPGEVRGGVLISDPPKEVPWRLHLATTRATDWEAGIEHELEVVTREGPVVRGRAVLSSTDTQAHMFFGVGELEISESG